MMMLMRCRRGGVVTQDIMRFVDNRMVGSENNTANEGE